MKNYKTILILTLMTFLFIGNINAQDMAADSPDDSGETGLDLNAVAELFKNSENLEAFEKNLNDSENGLNNLDLDENGEVDYIRVEENADGDTRVIAMQAVLGEDETQDVATIAVEKQVNNYNFHIHGTPTIYGANYYVVPRYRNFSGWSLIRWIFRPNYRPYRSAYRWRVYPRWWKVRRPVAYRVYRTRTVRFVGKNNFSRSRTVRVKTVKRVKYNQQTSTLVKKKKVVRKTNGNNTVVRKKGVKTQTRTNANGKTVTRSKGRKVVKNKKTGKKTVVKGRKKTVKTKKGKKTKVKKVKKVKKKRN